MTVLRPGLEAISINKWENKHENFEVRFNNPRSYRLTNPRKGESSFVRYMETTRNIQHLIEDAVNRNLEIKPMGRGWSFSKIGVGNNGFVDTMALRLAFQLSDKQIHADFKAKGLGHKDVWFVQCGNSVRAINKVLEKDMKPPRSIIASGASNGQTIAGATSTGTHGAGLTIGSVHDAILGIHLVVSKDKHVFIEPERNRVVSDDFIRPFKFTDHIVSNKIFDAVLVGMGSFGIIHGLLIKTAPKFLLEKYQAQMSYTAGVKTGLDNLDFSQFNLRPSVDANGELYHFEVKINPYKAQPGDDGVYLTYMYKIPPRAYTPRSLNERGFTYGDDTLGVVSSLLKRIPPVFNRAANKAVVDLVMTGQFKPDNSYPWFGTMGETFTYTSLKGKTASCAICVDKSDVSRVVDIVIDYVNNTKPFLGIIALRYVKGTKATLGFTKFDDSCVIELDGVDGPRTREFYNEVCQLIRQDGVDFTLHWGKINDYMQNNNLSDFYDQAKIDDWKEARDILFAGAPGAKRVFENQFLRNCQLT